MMLIPSAAIVLLVISLLRLSQKHDEEVLYYKKELDEALSRNVELADKIFKLDDECLEAMHTLGSYSLEHDKIKEENTQLRKKLNISDKDKLEDGWWK